MEQKHYQLNPAGYFQMSLNFKWLNWLFCKLRGSVARIAREHDINDNLLFKWLQALAAQRAYITASSGNELFWHWR